MALNKKYQIRCLPFSFLSITVLIWELAYSFKQDSHSLFLESVIIFLIDIFKKVNVYVFDFLLELIVKKRILSWNEKHHKQLTDWLTQFQTTTNFLLLFENAPVPLVLHIIPSLQDPPVSYIAYLILYLQHIFLKGSIDLFSTETFCKYFHTVSLLLISTLLMSQLFEFHPSALIFSQFKSYYFTFTSLFMNLVLILVVPAANQLNKTINFWFKVEFNFRNFA